MPLQSIVNSRDGLISVHKQPDRGLCNAECYPMPSHVCHQSATKKKQRQHSERPPPLQSATDTTFIRWPYGPTLHSTQVCRGLNIPPFTVPDHPIGLPLWPLFGSSQTPGPTPPTPILQLALHALPKRRIPSVPEMGPGAMVLTRILLGPHSTARCFAIASGRRQTDRSRFNDTQGHQRGLEGTQDAQTLVFIYLLGG